MGTFERVRSLVAQELNVDEEQITPEASLKEDLSADSLDVVELTMAMEETFEIEFGEDAMALATVQQIVDYIDEKLDEKA